MSEILTLSKYVKDLGSTVLIVGASIWLLTKFIPNQMKMQGETNEIIRNNSAVIENCTEVLRMVSVKDKEIQETLSRIEDNIRETNRDLHNLKHQLKGVHDE